MTNTLSPLVLDLIEWVAREPRDYADVIDAWRTSCPRLTVWEDAVDGGFIKCRTVPGQPLSVVVTDDGLHLLHARRPGASPV